MKLSSRAYDIAFPPGSEILTILAEDSVAYPAPSTLVGGPEAPEPRGRLRVLLYGRPADPTASLPAPLFAGPAAVAVQTLLRAAAAIGFDETAANSAGQI